MIKENQVTVVSEINPGTPIEAMEPVLPLVDQVLVMTVNPGFGGQSFIEDMVKKIKRLTQLKEKNNYHYDIEVDGGIVPETARKCQEAGANVFVAGGYIFGLGTPEKQI